MRKLANLIETELKKQEVCAVYNSESRAGLAKKDRRNETQAGN